MLIPVRRDREGSASPAAPPESARAVSTWRGSVPTGAAYDLVLVGGVPGAGKTTAIAQATDDLEHVRAIDPEHVAWWLRRLLPARVPYRAYRWIVHLLHTLRVLVHLLNGPVAGRRLVVHDPGTRARRRGLFLRLAHLGGWRTVLLYVDVGRSAAHEGQLRRGRVVRSFDEHWARWQRLRPALDAAVVHGVDAVRGDDGVRGSDDPATGPLVRDDAVILVGRSEAASVLRELCR